MRLVLNVITYDPHLLRLISHVILDMCFWRSSIYCILAALHVKKSSYSLDFSHMPLANGVADYNRETALKADQPGGKKEKKFYCKQLFSVSSHKASLNSSTNILFSSHSLPSHWLIDPTR